MFMLPRTTHTKSRMALTARPSRARLMRPRAHSSKLTQAHNTHTHTHMQTQDVVDREPFKSTTDAAARASLVKDLHLLKTDLFMELVETGAMPLRPGVARLVKEAIAAGECYSQLILCCNRLCCQPAGTGRLSSCRCQFSLPADALPAATGGCCHTQA